MGITADQLIARRGWIGSSDVASLFGCNPYQTEYDLYLDKTNAVEDRDAGDAAESGNRLEPALMTFAEETLGPIRRDVFYSRPEYHLGSHLDGEVIATLHPVEGKSTGVNGPVYGTWGEPGTDQIPDCFILQGHCHMICSPHDPGVCHYPVLLGGRGWFMYIVERNERLCQEIRERAMRFTEDHIIPGIPPTDSEPTLDVVEHLRRVPKTTVSIPMALFERWTTAKQAEKDAKAEVKAARVGVLKHMGKAEAVDVGDLGGATYLEQERAGFDLDRFKKDEPKLAAEYITVSRFRKLLAKKPKK